MNGALTEAMTEARHHCELIVRTDSVLLYGTVGLLLFGPLAFGAVESWSIFAIETGSALLMLLWLGKQAFEVEIQVRRNSLFLPMGVFGGLIGTQLVFQTTAYPHATKELALRYAAYGALCFLASQTLLRGSQARKLAAVFSIYGAAVACFALIQGISSNGKLYWLRQPRMGGWIYGPYVNHNHYAGLMEMLIPIPLVLSLTQLAPNKVRNLAAAASAIMVGTVFLSGSRGGMFAIVVELVILSFFFVRQKRGLRHAIALGLFFAIVVALLVWIGGSDLGQRVETIRSLHPEVSKDIRMNINRDGWRMFLQRPILGWGLGTFPTVYPEFRSFYTNFFVNEAHNDYLQLLVETGVLGFATMVWFLATLFRSAVKKIGKWSVDINGTVALACLLGLVGILVHSAVDFNLQIPGNAALFYLLCTMAASEPFLRPMRKRHIIPSKPVEEIAGSSELIEQPATNF
jgi:O-antigen ligase